MHRHCRDKASHDSKKGKHFHSSLWGMEGAHARAEVIARDTQSNAGYVPAHQPVSRMWEHLYQELSSDGA